MPIFGLLSTVVSGISTWFTHKQEISKVKVEAEKKMITAKANSEIAISEAKIEMAKQGQVYNANLDLLAMQNMNKSWKDEYVLFLFSIPMILSFTPWSEIALRGFEIIGKMPEWYRYTFIGMVVVIYGMRGMLNKVLTLVNKKL